MTEFLAGQFDIAVIGAGHAGPVTKHLQKEFFKVVKGENPKYAGWLHPVSYTHLTLPTN